MRDAQTARRAPPRDGRIGMGTRGGTLVAVRWAGCLAIALLSSLGCGDDLTQLIVVIDTDLAVPGEVDRIELVVDGPSENSVNESIALDRDGLLPLTFGLTPARGSRGPVSVTATALRGRERIVAQRVRTTFVEGRTLMLRLSLLRVCASRGACAGLDETCVESGACGAVDVPSASLPRWTGRPARLPATPPPMDASVDAGPDATLLDAGPPPIDVGPVDTGPVLDGSSSCPRGTTCDPAAQTGCPATFGCDIVTSGDLICRPAGPGGNGAPCSSGFDCIVGYGCISGAGPAQCRRLCCDGDDTVCPSGQRCLVSTVGPGSPYQACFPSYCDPVGQTGCPAGEQCYPRDEMGTTICVLPEGTGTQGDPCTGNINQCAFGYLCIGSLCIKQCRLGGGEPSCPAPVRCAAFPGIPTLGLCDG